MTKTIELIDMDVLTLMDVRGRMLTLGRMLRMKGAYSDGERRSMIRDVRMAKKVEHALVSRQILELLDFGETAKARMQ